LIFFFPDQRSFWGAFLCPDAPPFLPLYHFPPPPQCSSTTAAFCVPFFLFPLLRLLLPPYTEIKLAVLTKLPPGRHTASHVRISRNYCHDPYTCRNPIRIALFLNFLFLSPFLELVSGRHPRIPSLSIREGKLGLPFFLKRLYPQVASPLTLCVIFPLFSSATPQITPSLL